MKILNGFLALVFALFVAVQYNDPDPLQWMLMYGAVCTLCILAALDFHPKVPTAIVAAVALIWMLSLLPGFIAWIRMGVPTIVGSMKAEEPHIEVVREFLGLLIAFLASLHLLRLAMRHQEA